MPLSPLVDFQTAAFIAEEAKKREDANKPPEKPIGLAQFLSNLWQPALQEKRQSVENDMIEAVYAMRGKYSPRQEAELARNNESASTYIMTFNAKKRAMTAQIKDSIREIKPTCKPTPIPEINPELAELIDQQTVQQVISSAANSFVETGVQANAEVVRNQSLQLAMAIKEQSQARKQALAEEASAKMSVKIYDQLVESKWMRELGLFISDIAWAKSAIMKSPVIERKVGLQLINNVGKYEFEKTFKNKVGIKRVSPFDFYPEPAVRNIQDGYVFEIHKISRRMLYAMMSDSTFNADKIREALRTYRNGYRLEETVDSEIESTRGQSGSATSYKSTYDVQEFWGYVTGRMLNEYGLAVPDEDKDYHINAFKIGDIVIKAILNEDPLESNPYYMTSFEAMPDALWGNSLYDAIKDSVDMSNAAARGIKTNIPYAAQPLSEVNTDLMAEGESPRAYPGKTYRVTSDQMQQNTQAIRFFSPQLIVNELIPILEKGQDFASETSGIPRSGHGGEQVGTGAASTASGLSIIRGDLARQIKDLTLEIEDEIIAPCIKAIHIYNMMYDPDPDIKGDMEVVCEGVSSLMSKELHTLRIKEALDSTANEFDIQIMGLEGRKQLLEEYFKQLEVKVQFPVIQQQAIATPTNGSNRQP